MRKKIKAYFDYVNCFGWWQGTKNFFVTKIKKGGIVKINLNSHPIYLRANTSDIDTFSQIFLRSEYNFDFSSLQPKVVIDAGANIGLFGVQLKHLAPDAMLICVEPQMDNFNQLKKNLSFYKNVHFENAGLWYRNAHLKVYDKYQLGEWGMVVEETTEVESNIFATSISSLMEKYQLKQIDILKMDIETSEKIIFENDVKDWMPFVKTIIIELHDRMLPGCSKAFFQSVLNHIPSFELSLSGENILIRNTSLKD